MESQQPLKKFIDLGIAKNVTLDWTTNGTIVDEEVPELAKQYGHTKWTVSVEGTDGLYEYNEEVKTLLLIN